MIRGFIAAFGLILLWQGFVWLTDVPPFLLPAPSRVALALADRWDSIAHHALITGTAGVVSPEQAALIDPALRGPGRPSS